MEEIIKNAVDTLIKNAPSVKREDAEKIFRDYYEKGIPLYKSMGIDEDFMKFLYATAYQMYQSGKFKEACANFQILATYDPTDPKYVLGQGLCYQQLRKYPNAINAFVQCGTMNSSDPYPYWHIYECFEELHEPWGSCSALAAVIQICDQTNEYPELRSKAEIAMQNAANMAAKSSGMESKES